MYLVDMYHLIYGDEVAQISIAIFNLDTEPALPGCIIATKKIDVECNENVSYISKNR